MTREEMKKYLKDRGLEVVLDDDEDILIDDCIIATWNRAYLKINRYSIKFNTSSDGIDINSVTEKDLDIFHFSDIEECSKIRETAHRLLDEASRYDEILRNLRVAEVRKYFDVKSRTHKSTGDAE